MTTEKHEEIDIPRACYVCQKQNKRQKRHDIQKKLHIFSQTLNRIIMKQSLLTIAAALFSLSINASELQAWEKGDAIDSEEQKFDICVTNFKIIAESTLTIEEQYTGITYQGDQIQYAFVQGLGNGTTSVIRSNAGQYTAIVINSLRLTLIKAASLADLTNVTSFSIATTTPATVEAGAFPTSWATTCALTVPEASKEAYKTAWGQYFYSINGEVIEHGTPTAISNAKTSFSVRTAGKTIILSEATDVQVYSITGANVFSGTTDKIDVKQNGIYIVKTRNGVQKVSVK